VTKDMNQEQTHANEPVTPKIATNCSP